MSTRNTPLQTGSEWVLEGEVQHPGKDFCPDCGAIWQGPAWAKRIRHPDDCPSKGSKGPFLRKGS